MNTLKLKNSIFKIFIELFIFNKKTRSKIKSRWAKLHLKEHVDFAIKNTQIPANLNEDNNIIWQYWHQGIENAPPIIKKCFESVKKYHPECDIRILTYDTIKNYIDLPKKYYDFLEQKKIPIAIFSDVVRLYLLSQYGGMWIDSTIYLTGRIPDNILQADFFAFQKDQKTDSFEDKMTCFFIKAKANNIWIHLIKNAIESYWRKNDYLIHYFMFEHVVTMISDATPELLSDWNKMPYYSADMTGILQKKFFYPFDKEEFEKIKKETFLHKLTYKKDSETIPQNCFYKKLVED